MNLLVDSHILLRWFLEPAKNAKDIHKLIEDENNSIYYSAVSLWEIAVKYGLGKLSLGPLKPEEFADECQRSFLGCLPLDNDLLISSYQLPQRHPDPFDRLLIWQAIQQRMTLLSMDSRFGAYRQDGLRLLPE
ncbi:MAG: type II toxin-antitoxin system VapC family toxin [Coriobacteriales bacterium]|jgi:PIN domain nuclease of toxin-antitoxin system|nr:type II toxin-antitoxin system VapC family toxin [Coriobacteriales bacterium]